MIVETVKVKPWGSGQGDYVEINREDFDPKVHKLISESDIPKPKKSGK